MNGRKRSPPGCSSCVNLACLTMLGILRGSEFRDYLTTEGGAMTRHFRTATRVPAEPLAVTVSSRTGVRAVLAFLILLGASVHPSQAQVAGGSISGTISDPSGAAVAGGQVLVDDKANRTSPQ